MVSKVFAIVPGLRIPNVGSLWYTVEKRRQTPTTYREGHIAQE